MLTFQLGTPFGDNLSGDINPKDVEDIISGFQLSLSALLKRIITFVSHYTKFVASKSALVRIKLK